MAKLEVLQEMFCRKITLEYRLFKRRIMKNNKQDIFNNARQIEGMRSIYEILMGEYLSYPKEKPDTLLSSGPVLGKFYSHWEEAGPGRLDLWINMHETVWMMKGEKFAA